MQVTETGAGRHVLQVVLVTQGTNYLAGEREIQVTKIQASTFHR